ncbi:MAG: hypothetical protein J7559_12250, partial [Cohnella sp.]|nr:hypothetical protein [Cohnella sp.]
MAVRFGRVGNNNPTDGVVDHYDLLHKGVYTHAELDLIADEVSAARGSYPSLDARLESFVEGEGGGTTASYLFEAVIIDVPETTEVFISEFYTVGVKELDVFVGGVRQRTGIDYEETSSNSVTFTYGLMPGDVVAFRVRDRKGILKP